MPFSQMAASGSPRPDQIEVCVFGPNFGECIVLHLGEGNWAVVDSCVYGPDREPAALLYLRALGIAPATSIKVILATHWHDDHCKGISQIVEAAPDAPIWISQTLIDIEFLKFAARMRKNRTTVAGTKLREFTKIIDEIRRRREAGQTNFGFASFGTALHSIGAEETSHERVVTLRALSPSHGDAFDFLRRLAERMPAAKKTKHSVPSPNRNLVSVASLLSVGDLGVLLGADLPSSTNAGSGWSAVLQNHSYAAIGPRASLYKIAHHGSVTAHNSDVWIDLLISNASAVLTPWSRGGREVPNVAEIRAIDSMTQFAFATSHGARTRLSLGALPKAIRAQMRIRRVPMRSLEGPFGAVRFRLSNDKPNWDCELFGAACHIKQIDNRRRRSIA